MKISKVAIAITSLLVCSNVYATTVLKVWEDVQKSHGIAQAVADFEALNDCKVVVEEVPFISQVDRLRLEGPSGDGPDVLMISVLLYLLLLRVAKSMQFQKLLKL